MTAQKPDLIERNKFIQIQRCKIVQTQLKKLRRFTKNFFVTQCYQKFVNTLPMKQLLDKSRVASYPLCFMCDHIITLRYLEQKSGAKFYPPVIHTSSKNSIKNLNMIMRTCIK